MLSRLFLPVGVLLSVLSSTLVGIFLLFSGVLPGGDQVSFTFSRGWRSGPFAVHLIDVSRQLTHQLVSSYSIGNPGLPVTWSPDGERLAYSSYLHFENHETFIYDLDNQRKESLLAHPDADERGNAYNAVWSPDGHQIAFTGGVRGEDIYIAQAACMPAVCEPFNLTQHREGYAYLSWSPDSRSLAYVNLLGGSDIFVADVTTGERQNLSRHSSRDILPIWSPDGTRIAFLSTLGGQWYDVYVMNRDGSDVRRMTTGNPLQTSWRLSWSPDGLYLIYGIMSWGGGNDIYLIDVTNAKSYHMTRDESRDGWPSWSPDGKRILFESRTEGYWNIYVTERECAMAETPCDPIRLTYNQHDSRRPTWSPDGTRVACMGSPLQAWRTWDIYVIAADGTGTPVRMTSGNGREIHFSPLWRP